MTNMLLGRYIPGDSLIHRLDPRFKLLAMLGLMILVFFLTKISSYLMLLAFCLLLISLSQIPLTIFIKGLRPMLMLILFTVILQLIFSQGDQVIFQLGFLKLTWEGVNNAVYIFLRFVIIIFISTLLTLSTQPLALTDGMESLMAAFRRGLPVHEIALMFSIALRFIPTLSDETQKIMNAQRSRGVEFSEGHLIERIKKIIPILIPLFISAFNRAFELATAMEARGYQGGEGRSKLNELDWQIRDTWASIIVLLVILVCLAYDKLV
ncbi:hypothetical protein AWM75_03485 [Aerococcus urinaehominis]|uniref:Energy-coupling factor transporter transmembrane protein EcfT n=1 Tax=Aerococcus urinaehominis TaxID=128944 RepID=A0A0X8FKR2_9LACT|nr:energy-coupling factor transporter transmembrane protein EcfT [Aerococcus urinaehominis]AMB99121.1 hypothetical protein AWM75_03485 [Aerococcus urinaehominis]SDM04420.1 energy-coupling factor transport system permease protein [Aerococcus urinaehominis]